MAIAFVSPGAVATGTNPTVPVAPFYAEGNLLIIVTTGSATPTTPTGWTQRYAQGTSRFVTILTRYASSSEASVALTLTGTTSKAVMLCYSGAGSYDVVGTMATGISTAPATVSQTTTYANDYIISIYACSSISSSTFTAPAGTTSRVNSGSTGSVSGLLLVDELQAAAGASAVRTATTTVGLGWSAINISFVPTRTLYWVGGTGTWDTTTTGNWANTSGGIPGTIKPPVQNEIVNIDTSSGTGTITCGAGVCGDLSVTASQAIVLGAASSTLSVYGTLSFPSGGSFSASTNANTITMAATSAKTITTNGKTFSSLTFNGVSGNWTLPSAVTASASVTLGNGTITLSTNTTTLSCGSFSSSNSNTRVIAFGTGAITTTGSGTAFNTSIAAGLTYTGTPTVNISNNSATATTVTAHNTSGTEANAFNFNFTTGSYALTLTSAAIVRNLNFTGFTGTWAPSTATCTFYGSLTLVSGMTFTTGSGLWTWANTSGTAVITSASKTLFSITQNGVGGTVQLAAGTTTLSTTATYTLTAGTLDVGTNTATLSTGLFASNNSNTRSIIFGTGNITTTGSGTAWTTATATNLTYTGTPTVNISNSGATATTITAGTTGGTENNSFNFNFTTGTYTLTTTTNSYFRGLDFTGFTGTWAFGSTAAILIYGNFKLVSGMTVSGGSFTSRWIFSGTSGVQTITSAGKTLLTTSISNTGTSVKLLDATTFSTDGIYLNNGTLDLNSQTISGGYTLLQDSPGGSATFINGTLAPVSVSHSFGTLTLSPSGILTATGTYSFTNVGSLILGSNTLTCTTFSGGGSSAHSIDFGTGQITLTGNAATIWSTGSGLTYSGTAKIVSNYLGSTGTRTFTFGAFTVPFTVGSGSGNQFSFGTAGTDIITVTGSMASLDWTGFTGTWSGGTSTMSITSGNLTLVSGMTCTASTGAISFTATSGTQVLTSAGKTINPITINGVGGTVQLADAASINNATTLTNGTLNLNNQTLSTLTFSSSNSNTRAIQFGTGNITTTDSGTVWTTATATNLTYTGTPTVNISNNSATATTVTTHTTGGTSTNAFNFNFTTGTYDLTLTTASVVKSLDFTGFIGIWQPSTKTCTFYGNLTLVSGMTFTTGSGLWTFAATSGTQTITSAGKTLYAITQDGVGGTVALGDTFVSNNTYTLTNGTFNASNQNFTAANFSSSNANTRTITMGSGTWTLSGTGTVWNTATTTGLTFNKNTANIVLSNTTTTARTFAGGGLTYNNLTIGGATGISTTTFTGNNTFNTLASTKTVAHTITLPASGTTTVADWTITGTSGNVVTLNSSTAATQSTLTKTGGGVISGIDYLSIQDSNATPATTWYAGANSTNVSNNTGWIFGAVPGAANSKYFLLF